MKKLAFSIVAIAALWSCESPEDGVFSAEKLNGKVIPDKIAAEEFAAEVHETLAIGDNVFVLEAYLWRDFMPVYVDGSGRPMCAVNRLVDVNSVAIPDNISMVKQYVINGDSVWVADYENEAADSGFPYKKERISRNGPKWEPGIFVDVVSEIYDSATGTSYCIGVKNVCVARTD